MAAINRSLIRDKDKSSVSDRSYVLCDICEFNGCPNEKVVYRYEGQRSEDEEGFITRFTVYDYSIRVGKLHVYKYNEKFIHGLVNVALGNGRPCSNDR
jgi:hypothetical protein